jgi:beta-mannosidase
MVEIDLHGTWRLIQADTGETTEARVPGDNYTTLCEAGKIPDPFYGMNENEVQWVREKDWIYTREFEVPETVLSHTSVFLTCDSLDTITEIFINGKSVGKTDNMFRRYAFEVKEMLVREKNRIEIRFFSIPEIAGHRAAVLDHPFPVTKNSQVPHINLIRKVQCHAGWDWGICLLVAGIYGTLTLTATSSGRIDYITTTQHHKKGSCRVTVTAELFSQTTVQKALLEIKLGEQIVKRKITLKSGVTIVREEIVITNPKLWWPNGEGEQFLYDLTVTLDGQTVKKRLGLRTLELVREIDETGSSMLFRINGRDIFCKGANWIPIHAMPGSITAERYEYLLRCAASVHMNMLRVWGGGQYESDIFYRLCDEKGILVWQDFMFACMPYPGTGEFIANVEKESFHQVKRLKDHPCIALWCGNNEVLESFEWYDDTKQYPGFYLEQFTLINKVLKKVVSEHDPERVFWPGSPSNGPGNPLEHPQDETRGDIHFWKVWHGGQPFESYTTVRPRFCSEFGFQSFPSIECIKSFAPQDQWDISSPVMRFHQRSPRGNEIIKDTFDLYFKTPSSFERCIWLSQVQQALAVKTAVESFRSLRPHCMGALYWQLNDIWPVSSWSSIEFDGKWKLLHYCARRFYAPVIPVLIIRQESNTGELLVVSDQPGAVHDQLTFKIFDFSGKCLQQEYHDVEIEKPGVINVKWLDIKTLPEKPENLFLVLTLGEGEHEIENSYMFCPYKHCLIQKANVNAAVHEENGETVVRLSTDFPAFFVTLHAKGTRGEFSDNCFTLLPGREKRIRFHPQDKPDAERLGKVLEVEHLGMG